MSCSISGYISRAPSSATVEKLCRIIMRAEERGRDSCGIAGAGFVWRALGRPSLSLPGTYIPPLPILINNNRAEPTTEYVPDKHLSDVQPFVLDEIAVAHNGTIANDRELRHRYDLHTESSIDSAVIPPLIARFGVRETLRLLIGSYALAVSTGDKLYLACNYKPIFLLRQGDTFFFSSLDDYLRESWEDDIIQLPPYSLTEINTELEFNQVSLRPPKERRRALVICSGGLDSTVAATHYVRSGYQVTLLHFTYGCRGEDREVTAVQAIADFLNCEVRFIDLQQVFRGQIKGSRLTDSGQPLQTARQGEASAELAWEWVPARNLVFYALALAYAEGNGYDILALGNNLEESGAYPDNEMIFTRKFADLIPYAVNLDVDIQVEMPVGNLMKHEIVALGMQIGAPLHLTWSCYNSGPLHCGTCGPCYMRRKAFQMNGIEEVIEYAT